jgi:hypothetical protein
LRVPIHQSPPFDTIQCAVSAGNVTNTTLDAVAVTEVELGEIAVQMPLLAMLVHTLHTALENAVLAFNGVRRNEPVGLAANVLVVGVFDGVV